MACRQQLTPMLGRSCVIRGWIMDWPCWLFWVLNDDSDGGGGDNDADDKAL